MIQAHQKYHSRAFPPTIHAVQTNVAMEMILTGDPIGAQRAYDLGFVNILTEPGTSVCACGWRGGDVYVHVCLCVCVWGEHMASAS